MRRRWRLPILVAIVVVSLGGTAGGQAGEMSFFITSLRSTGGNGLVYCFVVK